MEGVKRKIDINDLRTDKGGDPERYRQALEAYYAAKSCNHTQPGTGSDGNNGNNTTSLIDEALNLETRRRQTTTELETLRAKSSKYQKEVIFPKKKENQDISQEVAQLKEWKAEISTLSKDLKELEKNRNEAIAEINKILESLSELDSTTANPNVGSSSISPHDVQSQQSVQETIEQNSSRHANHEQCVKDDSSQATSDKATKSCETPDDESKNNASKITQTTENSSSLPLLSPEQIKAIPPERILNLNVGVLGHVDTGKTSLVKTLSSVLSTAALDKSKQSRARGITLDLGFSAFLLPLPDHLRGNNDTDGGAEASSHERQDASDNSKSYNSESSHDNNLQQKYDLLQVTLVDCPGHASLIRTIIGGAQIIDMVLLVVDATKGMQTQTAECLVIAEMTTRNLIVVLNKVDLFPEGEREERLQQAKNKMRIALKGTKFEDAQMVGISACVGGEKVAAVSGAAGEAGEKNAITGTHNIHGLLDILQSQIRAPSRDAKPSPDRFHFAVDHCFPIKGQGTVLTGTCLSGSARPNEMVEFPTLATQKKIKGLQMFRRKANVIQQGDRAGICVSNFDAKLMERGIIASPGTVKLIRGAIAVVRKVRFFKGGLNSGAKFHVSVGHTTVMATVTFWGAREIAAQVEKKEKEEEKNSAFNTTKGKDKSGSQPLGKSSLGGSADLAGLPRLKFDWNQDFLHQDNYLETLPTNDGHNEWNDGTLTRNGSENMEGGKQASLSANKLPPLHWAKLEFLTPVYCPMDSLVIGSRLDTEVNANACRLAFSGRLVERYDAKTDNGKIKTYTKKEKVGTVCRLGDPFRRSDDNKVVRYEVFGTDLFKKETNMSQFVGLVMETDRGEIGSIQSSFGTSGKFRVNFPAGTEAKEGDPLYLRFKRYANDPKKAIHQDQSLPRARPGYRIDPPAKKKKVRGKISNGNANVVENGVDSKTPKGDRKASANIPNGSNGVGEIVKTKGDILQNGKRTVAIVSGLFSMEDDISKHKGRKVISITTPEEEGVIDGSFGKVGKCKVLFRDGISADVGSHVKMLS